jgi:hypothetical protein
MTAAVAALGRMMRGNRASHYTNPERAAKFTGRADSPPTKRGCCLLTLLLPLLCAGALIYWRTR